MIKIKCHASFVGMIALGLLLFFFLESGPAFARGNLRIGRLKVTTGLEYKLEYNDNIFSEQTNEEDDVIHTVTPAISFDYEGTPGNFFSVGYNVDLVAYSEFTDNNYQAHRPHVTLGLKIPAGFYLKAGDSFVQTADPYGTSTQYGRGSKTKRYDNTADFVMGYEFFGRFGVEAMYRHYLIRYDLIEDMWQDRTDNRYGGSVFYKLTTKTSVFLQYRRTLAEYDEQNNGVIDGIRNTPWSSSSSQDYNLNDYFLGARFEPGGKLSGEIKLGYGDKNFDNMLDIDGIPYEDIDSWIAETSLDWQAGQRTLWTLGFKRSHEPSPDADASSYIDTIARLALRQGLANRLTVKLGFEFNKNDYQHEAPGLPEKDFDIYTVTAGIDWAIKPWLTTGLSYEYKSKNAGNVRYQSSEYDSNRALLFISEIY